MYTRPRMPTRAPDYENEYVSIWWEERVIATIMSGYFYFNPDNWTYYSFNFGQIRGIEAGFALDLNHVKNAYVNWLLEKQLLE